MCYFSAGIVKLTKFWYTFTVNITSPRVHTLYFKCMASPIAATWFHHGLLISCAICHHLAQIITPLGLYLMSESKYYLVIKISIQ